MLFGVMRRVQKLESQRGANARGRCSVCEDGARPSGLVFRIEGAAQGDVPLPVCAGCGRCNPLIYDIVVAERPAA